MKKNTAVKSTPQGRKGSNWLERSLKSIDKAEAESSVQTSALPPADTEEYRSEPIAIGLLDESPTNQRRTYNSAGLAELAASLKSVGMIQAMVVRRKGKRFEIVVGSRRYRAAKIAGLASVPATVRELTDAQVRIIQLIENLQRANVNPLEEALGYRELMKSTGYDVPAVAAKISKSVSYVYQRLKLADLIEPAQKAFRSKELTPGHAILIARLPEAWQKRALADCARGATVRQLAEWIHRELHRDVKKGGFDPTDGALVKGVPACAACPKLSGNAAGLYPEIKSKTMCTDADCYQRKGAAHVKAEMAAAEKRGEKLVQIRIGCEYDPDLPKEALRDSDFTLIAGQVKPCGETKKAIVVSGAGRGKIVSICAAPKCKQHHARRAGSGSDKAYFEKQRKEKRAADIARVVRGRIVDALLDSMTASAPALDPLAEVATWLTGRLEDWAEQWWERLWNDAKHLVRKRHPEWDADTIPIGDLNLPELMRLLNEICLAPELMVCSWGEKESVPKDLQARCEEHRVVWQAIEAQVRTEFAEKDKKKTKPAKAEVPAAAKPIIVTTGAAAKLRQRARILARLEKYAAMEPAGQGWPRANEHNVFEARDCFIIDAGLKDVTAQLLLVQTSMRSWHSSYSARITDSASSSLPHSRKPIYECGFEALIGALDGLITWAKGSNSASSKGRREAKKILDWTRALWIDAVAENKRVKQAGVVIKAGSAELPAAEAETASAEVLEAAPISDIVQCPNAWCGAYLVPGALDAHMAECNEAVPA